jgi:hypothetical protein
MTSSEIELTTFLLVAYFFDQLRYRVPTDQHHKLKKKISLVRFEVSTAVTSLLPAGPPTQTLPPTSLPIPHVAPHPSLLALIQLCLLDWTQSVAPAHAGSLGGLFLSSTLHMEAMRSSETSVNTISTRRHIPEDGSLQFRW